MGASLDASTGMNYTPEASVASLVDTHLPGLLHPAYGYILLVVLATYIVALVQGFLVGKMREKYKVELPAMYSDTEPMFNCYQRVHQNSLERIPLFLALLLLAGLFNSGVANNRVVGSLMNLACDMALGVMVFLQVGQMA